MDAIRETVSNWESLKQLESLALDWKVGSHRKLGADKDSAADSRGSLRWYVGGLRGSEGVCLLPGGRGSMPGGMHTDLRCLLPAAEAEGANGPAL